MNREDYHPLAGGGISSGMGRSCGHDHAEVAKLNIQVHPSTFLLQTFRSFQAFKLAADSDGRTWHVDAVFFLLNPWVQVACEFAECLIKQPRHTLVGPPK